MNAFLEYVLSIFWVFLEIMCIYLSASAFLPEKAGRSTQLLSFFAIWFICSLIACLEVAAPLRQITTLFLAFIWTQFLFHGSWIKHVLLIILTYVFTCVIDIAVSYGISALLGITFQEMVWKKLLYIVVVSVAKFIQILIAYLFRQFRRTKGTYPIKIKWLLLAVLFPAVSLVMLVVIFENYQDNQDLTIRAFLFSGILAAANVAILYLIHVMERTTKKEAELILLNSQMDIQTKSILALEQSYRAQQKAVHDFQHRLQTIRSLLESQNISAAQDYLTQLLKTQTTRIFCVNSRHLILDAVLNQKYQAAKESNIDIQIQVNDLSQIRLPTDALVVMISNLLDNAIEACQKLPENRMIQCRIIAEETLLISIRNTSMPVSIINSHIPTDKEPREEHGYGLSNVRHIMELLHAEYAFRYADGWFQFGAEIPLE